MRKGKNGFHSATFSMTSSWNIWSTPKKTIYNESLGSCGYITVFISPIHQVLLILQRFECTSSLNFWWPDFANMAGDEQRARVSRPMALSTVCKIDQSTKQAKKARYESHLFLFRNMAFLDFLECSLRCEPSSSHNFCEISLLKVICFSTVAAFCPPPHRVNTIGKSLTQLSEHPIQLWYVCAGTFA